MAGLLDGLASLGLGSLEGADIFGEEKEKKAKEKKVQEIKKIPEFSEKDFIYDRAHECPICDHKFTSKTMKTGKAKLLGADLDLRPQYEGIDATKYDVIVCPHCGYSCITRYFTPLPEVQIKLIKENICSKIKLKPHAGETYTYEEALENYKLALACAVVKRAKVSEKAYVCLKSGWLMRGMQENLQESDENYATKKEEYLKAENEYLKNAMEGLLTARQTESFPICGMDEHTIDYLVAVLAIRFKELEKASRLVAGILGSATANTRAKEKARDLKDMILQELKAQKK